MLLSAGFRLIILTKSDLIRRDFDILAGKNVRVGVTITTPDEALARMWEPDASPVSARWRVLREARAEGLETSVMFGPLLPGLSDTPEALRELFEKAAEVGVDQIWTDALNPRPRVWAAVRALLGSHWPGLVEQYRCVLFDAGTRQVYVEELNARFRKTAADVKADDRLA